MSLLGILAIIIGALVLVLAPFIIGRDARFDPGKHRVQRSKRPGWRGR